MRLQGKKIAIIAKDGFEESELTSPRDAIKEAGGEAVVISDSADKTLQAFQKMEQGARIDIDLSIDDASAEEFDGLLIPGGLFSPDQMRTDERYLGFVRAFFEQKKPVAAICHGPQVLISADLVKGRKMTAVPAVRIDLENAGAMVVDEPVVVDQGLVTSRTPKDLNAFNAKIVEEFCEGEHSAQRQSVA